MSPIKFTFYLTNADNRVIFPFGKHKMLYPEMLDVYGEFKIIIYGKTIYDQPLSVLELLQQTEKWKHSKKPKDMLYISIETNDNPNITFHLTDGQFRISSPWQLFESHDLFTKDEIATALDELKESVKEQMQVEAERQRGFAN